MSVHYVIESVLAVAAFVEAILLYRVTNRKKGE